MLGEERMNLVSEEEDVCAAAAAVNPAAVGARV